QGLGGLPRRSGYGSLRGASRGTRPAINEAPTPATRGELWWLRRRLPRGWSRFEGQDQSIEHETEKSARGVPWSSRPVTGHRGRWPSPPSCRSRRRSSDGFVAHAQFTQVLRVVGNSDVGWHVSAIDDHRLDRYRGRGSNSLRPCPPQTGKPRASEAFRLS